MPHGNGAEHDQKVDDGGAIAPGGGNPASDADGESSEAISPLLPAPKQGRVRFLV